MELECGGVTCWDSICSSSLELPERFMCDVADHLKDLCSAGVSGQLNGQFSSRWKEG